MARLYDAVIEIRDAALALRPYGTPDMAMASTDGSLGHFPGRAPDAAAEAAVLIHSLDVAGCQQEGRRAEASRITFSADLSLEASILAKVSRTFAPLA